MVKHYFFSRKNFRYKRIRHMLYLKWQHSWFNYMSGLTILPNMNTFCHTVSLPIFFTFHQYVWFDGVCSCSIIILLVALFYCSKCSLYEVDIFIIVLVLYVPGASMIDLYICWFIIYCVFVSFHCNKEIDGIQEGYACHIIWWKIFTWSNHNMT